MTRELMLSLKRSWQSHFLTNIATITVLTLCFCLVLGLILVNYNLGRALAVWGEDVQLTVYLNDEITSAQKTEIESKLRGDSRVESVKFVSKGEAAKTFQSNVKELGAGVLDAVMEDGNPFPASFQVKLDPVSRTPEQIESVAETFIPVAGVEEVSFGREWIRNYSTLVKVFQAAAFFFTFVVVLACIFTISNSVRASLATRRNEIEILELVGATSKAIRRPFVLEGAAHSCFSMMLALFLLFICFQLSEQYLSQFLTSAQVLGSLSFFSFGVVLLFIGLSAVTGAAGSFICVARLNTGWAASVEKEA